MCLFHQYLANTISVLAGVRQGSLLETFLNIDGLKSNANFLADDTALLSVDKNKEESADDPTNDIITISTWVYNWKISSRPLNIQTCAKGVIS